MEQIKLYWLRPTDAYLDWSAEAVLKRFNGGFAAPT